MDESLRAQIDTYLRHLDHLIERGRQLRDALTTDSSNMSATRSHSHLATRLWSDGQSIVRWQ